MARPSVGSVRMRGYLWLWAMPSAGICLCPHVNIERKVRILKSDRVGWALKLLNDQGETSNLDFDWNS